MYKPLQCMTLVSGPCKWHVILGPRPRVHQAFQVQDRYYWTYFPLSVKENLIYVSIDNVNVVLDI